MDTMMKVSSLFTTTTVLAGFPIGVFLAVAGLEIGTTLFPESSTITIVLIVLGFVVGTPMGVFLEMAARYILKNSSARSQTIASHVFLSSQAVGLVLGATTGALFYPSLIHSLWSGYLGMFTATLSIGFFYRTELFVKLFSFLSITGLSVIMCVAISNVLFGESTDTKLLWFMYVCWILNIVTYLLVNAQGNGNYSRNSV